MKSFKKNFSQVINFKNTKHLLSLWILFCMVSFTGMAWGQGSPRMIIPFDKDWRFLQSDVQGAENIGFNDTSWQKLDIPHDWSIEGETNIDNPSGSGGGYLPDGIGWYRKTFSLSMNDASRLIFIDFDGVMANSDVWINGFHLGKRPYGYVSFAYELTGHLNFGNNKSNVIAVRADNSAQPDSRWYTGAGIYRHVRLVVTNPLHIAQWGIFITTPEVSAKNALVRVRTTVVNPTPKKEKITLKTILLDKAGKTVQTGEQVKTIAAGDSADMQQEISVNTPYLWNIDNPYLYSAITSVYRKGREIDRITTPFGIRDAKFEAATGFWLNGKNIKLKGVCLHHDGGAVGAAVPLAVWERRLNILKKTGVNAIRTSHNPVAPEFLDLCDRMGFLVMDETFDTWMAQKRPADFGYQLYFKDWWRKDTHDIVMRDRNHPCIVIYSVGNEIHDNLNNPEGFKKYKEQNDLIHSLDSSRPVTMALFRPNSSHVYTNGFANLMDVVGQNYRENELVAAHEAHPDWKVIGTENGHSREAWLALRDNPFMAGQFLWTGIDYLGESKWPFVVHGSGLIDKTGTIKPRGYERQSWWSENPMVAIARTIDSSEMKESDGSDGTKGIDRLTCDWTPINIDAYKTARVQVFSNCKQVELFLNGKSLGLQKHHADDSPCKWTFPFEPGTLKAVGYNDNIIVATDELKTAGKPSKIVLSADKKTIADNWDDVVYVTATVTDSSGIRVPYADHLISFSVSGPGNIIATDNGSLLAGKPYHLPERNAFQGTCIAILRASAPNGKITINAKSRDLQSDSVTLDISALTGN